MKTCRDCFNLKASIPVKNGEILYSKATARCREGHLEKSNGEVRIVKNVLKNSAQDLQLFRTAERCPDYDG